MMREEVLRLVLDAGARADERHVAAQDVDQLRELVEARPPKPLPASVQGIDLVFNPVQIGQNPRFISIIPARKVDISGRIALHIGKGAVATTPGEAMDFINGAELSKGGCVIFALPSRNLKGNPNILLSVEELPNLLGFRESVDMVITEYGVANLRGRTVRERAQALIDVAHPEDRERLVEEGKKKIFSTPTRSSCLNVRPCTLLISRQDINSRVV